MIKGKKFIYIASPFSHSEEKIRDERVEAVEKFVAKLQCDYAHEYVIFSPIVHSGHVSKYMPVGKFQSFDFWIGEIDNYFLELADEIWIFQYDGWDISRGVLYEINYAEKKAIPIRYWKRYDSFYSYGISPIKDE